jgi:hypothetical protein
MRSRLAALAAIVVVGAGIGLYVHQRDGSDARPAAGSAAAPSDAPPGPEISVKVGSEALPSIDATSLRDRPPSFTARDRRAWRLADLIGDSYRRPELHIHVRTASGGDFIVRGAGHPGDDVIVVQRDDGSMYVGWLRPNAAQYGNALADAEKPAERIEGVVAISAEAPSTDNVQPKGHVDIVKGSAVASVDADGFASIATGHLTHGDESIPVMPFDAPITSVTSEGHEVTPSPPFGGAVPWLRLNKKGQFKLVWGDAAGNLLAEGSLRAVTRVVLRAD